MENSFQLYPFTPPAVRPEVIYFWHRKEITGSDTVMDAAADEMEMVPVVVSVPEGWEAPNVWAWADDGFNAFASWPGEEMESWEEGWYYIYGCNTNVYTK